MIKNRYLLAVAMLLSFLWADISFAQLNVSPSSDGELMVETLLGEDSGIEVSNISFTGADSSSGTFSDGMFGLESGVLLTTGELANAVGPNTSGASSGNNGTPGDSDLEEIVGATTNDAAVLQFDLVPSGTSLSFSYVFASEEYNEYVCSSFNDVFAFLVNGGEYDNQNVALVPGANLPVAINTVNNGMPGSIGSCTPEGLENAEFFVDNEGGAELEYDGYSVVFDVNLDVEPGVTYTLKLAIADVADAAFDSGVFIEGESLVSADCNGGTLTVDGPSIICKSDGIDDSFTLNVEGAQGENMAYVVTFEDGEIIMISDSPEFNLEGIPGNGTCLFWNLAWNGNLEGAEVGLNANDLSSDDCFDLSNPVSITEYFTDGGEISTDDPTTICAGDSIPDPINVILEGEQGENMAWVITDSDLNILDLPAGPPFDLDGAGVGVCLIWNLSWSGELNGAEIGLNAGDLSGDCFDLSNSIEVTREDCSDCTADGGVVTVDGPTVICKSDGIDDSFSLEVEGAVGENMTFVVTFGDGEIIAISEDGEFNLEGIPGNGTCLFWNLSWDGEIEGAEVGLNAFDLEGDCFDLSDPVEITEYFTDGGEISTDDPTTICAGDSIPDPINVTLEGEQGENMAWVITDSDLNILDLPAGPPFDLDGAGVGVCLIWNLSWSGELNGAEIGLNAGDLSGDCFDLSNSIEVTREDCDVCDADGGILAIEGAITYNRAVIANRASGTISVIDSDNNEVLDSYDMPNDGEPMYVVYNNSNNTVLVGDYNGGVVAFDGVDFSVTGTAEAGDGVFHMWLSPDNQQLWVNNELDKTISLIDPNTMTNLTTFDMPDDLNDLGYKPHDVVVMPNNAAAFVTFLGAGEVGYVVKYDATTFEELARAEVGGDPHVINTAANDKLYVASQDSDELAVLNRSDLSEVTVLDIPNAHGLGINRAGTYLYVGNIAGGGTDATYTVDLSDNTLVGDAVDAPFASPHNYSVTEGDDKLFLTHSGSASNDVSIYELGPEPTLITSVETGINPFGLVTYSYTDNSVTICVGDSIPDPIDVTLEGNEGENMAWVITDSDLNILDLPAGPPFDLDGAGVGVCLIWNLSWTGELEGAEIGANAGDLEGDCFDLSNPIEVTREECDDCTADGGVVTVDGPTVICKSDGIDDSFSLNVEGAMGENMTFVVTFGDGEIIALSEDGEFNLEGIPGNGTCLFWNLSWDGEIEGAEVGLNAFDITGDCFDLSEPVEITEYFTDGGEISTDDPTTICAGDSIPDPINVTLEGEQGENMAWVITDSDLNILDLPAGPPFDLDGAGVGVCLIWNLSWSGELNGAEIGLNAGDLSGDCFDLSNSIEVTREDCDECTADGGELTVDGPTTICKSDGIDDSFTLNVEGAEGENMTFVVTWEDGEIILISDDPEFNLEGIPGNGTCLFWNLSWDGEIEGAEVGLNAFDITGDCFDLSNSVPVTEYFTDGGVITTQDPTTICVGDSIPDPINVTLEGNEGENMAWVITDSDLNILDLPAGSPFDLDGAGEGTCLIWNLSWSGELEGAEIGLNAGDLSGDCFDLSNSIEVVREICTTQLTNVAWEYDLYMAPNPTEGDALVTYTSNKNGQTNISILNLNGQRLEVLLDQYTEADVKYTLPFDGNNLPSGMYMFQITDGQSVKMQKFMIAR